VLRDRAVRPRARVCDDGFCVEMPCPSPCTSCNLPQKTCRINCDLGVRRCADLACPAGFDCTIECDTGSCGDIDCRAAASCNIDCSGTAACGNILCGAGDCEVDCNGPTSCPFIDCASSCRCEVTCSNSLACPSMSCPVAATGELCTEDGIAGEPCDPLQDPILCDTCL
jgi:hypothetical protein